MRRLIAILLGLFLWVASLAQAEPSLPPLVPEGEKFSEVEKLLASISSRNSSITAIAFSPDGATLASSDYDGSVQLWDVASGRERLTLTGHTDGVNAIAFSPDGATLASGSNDGSVRLWDMASGRQRLALTGATWFYAIAFSPDGATLASGSADNTVRLWDMASGRQRLALTGHTASVKAIAFSPDGATLASGSADNTVRLWDMASGRHRLTLTGLSASVEAVAFSPDGATLAAGSWEDHTVRLWDVANGRLRLTLTGHTDGVRAVAFSPDGATLASGSDDNTVRLWDVASGRPRLAPIGHTAWVTAVAFSPDGATLASGSWDNTVRLWDMASGRQRQTLTKHADRVWAVAFSPDGATLASGSADNTARLWDMASGRQRQTLTGHTNWVNAVVFSPDGATLASSSADGSVRLWDVTSGHQRQILTEHASIRPIAFSPDGATLAAGSSDANVSLWDVASGRQRRILTGHAITVEAVAFSPDGATLASSGSADDSVRLWDVASGRQRQILTGHTRWVRAVAFSPDGTTLASGSDDSSVRLWDVASGRQRQTLTGHTGEVNAVVFSPDGATLASGSYDHTVRLWDVASGRQRQTLTGHTDRVWAVAFSPDGATLASGSADDSVRLWSRVKRSSDYRLSRIIVAGQRGTWITCDMQDSRCLRHDDGTLLLQSSEDGKLTPVPPPLPDTPANLHLALSPPALQTTDGAATPFKLTIRNQGAGRAYWINVLTEGDSKQNLSLVFHPPTTQTILEPGTEAELECHLSALSSPENPRSQSTALRLKITSAHGEPIPVTIPVTTHTPSLDWGEAHWLRDKDRSILTVSLTNSGAQALTATEFKAQLAGQPAPLDIVNREGTQAGERFDLSFALPENLKLDKTSRVSLSALQLDHPMHRWQFTDRPVILPTPPWQLYTVLALLMLGTGVGAYYLYLYRHPLVTRLSAQPEALLELPPTELPQAKKLLTRTYRLNSVLEGVKVHPTWLEGALAFTRNDPQERCQVLARRLGLSCQPRDASREWWTLPLGERFPLNLNQCLLYLPPASLAAANIRTRLQNYADLADQVILILSPDPTQQTELHQWATDPGNLWVAPTPAELTGLLLATDPIANLARLIAAQIPFKRLSPYQTGGGLSREAMFFGRSQELAHILNRELTNYLVMGGRQIGKTTLLKALERRYQDKPQITCHYLVLSDTQLIERLARTLGLPPHTDLDGILSHLAGETHGARVLLIDEADLFIRAERERNYSTLRQLRALSEEGRCYFILAGFWELYAAAVLDYQSPLKNFGEVLQLGALEAPACRDLASKPMTTMNLRYRSEDLVERLVTATGQRANLISIACNQILQSLTLHDRMIEADVVERALDSNAIRQALTGWETLDTEDPAGSQRDRIIVYTTIERDAFTQPELLRMLDALGYSATPEQVHRSLERLQLAYVIQREKEQYRYCVPLFRDWVLVREPHDLLRRELAI